MKKIFSLAALLLGMSLSDMAYAAPDEINELDTENNVDDLFLFNFEDIDATTAFIELGNGSTSLYNDNLHRPEIPVGTEAQSIISYARQYLGKPYRSGAKGPKAFDCSGFTSFVFRNFDISLSASSSAQATQGVSISRNDCRPGDLVFFQGRRSKGVGHVGLVIDADGKGDITFIHAATSSGVRIDRLSQSAYYQKRYISVRRVLN